ncbi:hypothetical protein NUW58_g10420 [Xylaria curta]|uniref:Uncharacterized protein n=1 Tax=Xylaria curta TaxID=42375 RepID=A0ACC1MLM7_9PEZI|nr:hypothetical protein NUW58_g10420 [Xylaria curta]
MITDSVRMRTRVALRIATPSDTTSHPIEVARAQGQGTNKLQSVGFNSTFALSAAQIEAASLSADTAADIEATVRFDRSQLATAAQPRMPSIRCQLWAKAI